MEQRDSGERRRWLLAVSIVTAIGLTDLGIWLWPAPPSGQPLLSGRPLPFFHASVLITNDTPVVSSPGLVPLPKTAPRIEAAAATHRILSRAAVRRPSNSRRADRAVTAGASGGAPHGAAAGQPEDDAATAQAEAVPSLTSMVSAAPPSGAPALPAEATRGGLSRSAPLVHSDTPAAAVSRAFGVAGRGIRSGLLATGAAFRGAF